MKEIRSLVEALYRRIFLAFQRGVDFFDCGFSHGFDVFEVRHLTVAYQRDGCSFAAHPRSSADAVEVHWRVHGDVVVDNVRYALNI